MTYSFSRNVICSLLALSAFSSLSAFLLPVSAEEEKAITTAASTTSTSTSTSTTTTTTTSSSSSSSFSQDNLQTLANDAFWKRDFKAAKSDVVQLLKGKKITPEYKARCLANLSICESQLDEWGDARDHSLAAYKLAAPKTLTLADAAMVQARCLLLAGKLDAAIALYKESIATIVSLNGAWDADLAPYYEGLAGCYMLEKKYDEAEVQYRKVAQLDLIKYGPDDTHLAWSLLSLMGTEKALKHQDVLHHLYKKVFWNFRHLNELRILSECKNDEERARLVQPLRDQLYGNAYGNRNIAVDYISEGIPAEVLAKPSMRAKTFENWFKERVGRERAPGLAFFDPTKELKGLIVTVHGLGLYGGAYKPFAEQIQHEGFGVVSFDVRGFGSYRNDEVFQQIDLKAAMHDIKRVLAELRDNYPHTPIILLGESMGGAIVLHIAAESPELVDAVISSVPSGSRYQGKKTAVKVGLKFLNHKHRQFDIGTSVVNQATASSELRDLWEGDPQARMKLSAVELLRFQNFMSDNIKAASNIKKTPVIIFQGYSDNLVKPMGTLAIYQAIPNKDKDLIFLGRAEHLIFEEGQFDQVTLRGVTEWINRHLPSTESKQTH